LVRDGAPDPGDLAVRWVQSIGIQDVQRQASLIEEMEPEAARFLFILQTELAKERALQELFNSRALERIARDVDRLAGSRTLWVFHCIGSPLPEMDP
jgi:hypothetical protein